MQTYSSLISSLSWLTLFDSVGVKQHKKSHLQLDVVEINEV